MRRIGFFRKGMVISVCMIALLILGGAVFISVVWAKPPSAETKTYYGYARLTDTADYVIWSDDGRQYIDKNIEGANGEDYVRITTKATTGNYVKSFTVLGVVEYQSSRRARYFFDLYNDATTKPGEGLAIYDILAWTDKNKTTRRGNREGDKWYLNDGTVHFRVVDDTVFPANDNVAFIIDPGWDGKNPLAITNATVNGFYSDDKLNQKYEASIHGHVIYYLEYSSGISADGTNPMWTIAPSGAVTLYVKKKVGAGYERINLATYEALPFNLTISLKSIP